jgi:RNA polymerase sigma-70 factor (ECF subfamily)
VRPIAVSKRPEEALSDEDLVARCRLRDEAAVRTLTTRHNRRLFRIARGILRDDAEAEDVVQDTYVRAFTSLAGFRGEASFATWLTRIAMNEALGRLRKRRPTVEWVEDGEDRVDTERAMTPLPSRTRDPERIMADRQMHDLLEGAIDRLPDAFRTVFIARMVEGLSIEETADLFGIRPETVKTRVHRARLRLRHDLDRQLRPMLSGAFSFDGARCARLTEAVVRALARADGAVPRREPFAH